MATSQSTSKGEVTSGSVTKAMAKGQSHVVKLEANATECGPEQRLFHLDSLSGDSVGIGSVPGESGGGNFVSLSHASKKGSIVPNIRRSLPVGTSSPIKKPLESRKKDNIVNRTTGSQEQSGAATRLLDPVEQEVVRPSKKKRRMISL